MLASGNGHPMQCVSNLIHIVRGECTYDRVKGIDPSYIDQPETIVKPLLLADIKWLIKTYEPRVNIESINLDALSAICGDFILDIDASITGG